MTDLFGEVRMTGSVERVIFANAETGFSIAVFAPVGEGYAPGHTVKIIGEFPADAGQKLSLVGKWETDKRQGGKQLRVTSISLPETDEEGGLAKLIVSLKLPGVGEKTAEKWVERFGEGLDEVLSSPLRVMGELHVKGERAEEISKKWVEARDTVATYKALLGMGLTYGVAKAAVARWGAKAGVMVAANPYILMRLDGIGFRRADEMARKAGVGVGDERRRKAVAEAVVAEGMSDGSTVLYFNRVREVLDDMELGFDAADVCKDIEALACEKDPSVVVLDIDGLAAAMSTSLHYAETRLGMKLATMAGGTSDPVPFDAAAMEGLTDEQAVAVQLAVSSSVCAITGGPGRGKTHCLKQLVGIFRKAGMSVALCAPTGKAAKRMGDSIGERSSTIHRLLEYKPGTGFTANEANPLSHDVVIVDESSMIDSSLCWSLVAAVKSDARLIFVGDADQLPPVGAGSPFRDILACGVVKVARLTRIMRQADGSSIPEVADAIIRGEMPRWEGKEAVWRRMSENPMAQIVSFAKQAEAAVGHTPRNGGLLLLCPQKARGAVSVQSLNAAMEYEFNLGRPHAEAPEEVRLADLKIGARIMVTKNLYALDLYNGDQGELAGWEETVDDSGKKEKSLVGMFDPLPGETERRRILIPSSNLISVVPSYAITVHKSQGSEAPVVIVVICDAHIHMMNRQLLYTAITRAREKAVVVASEKALRIAISKEGSDTRVTYLRTVFEDAGRLLVASAPEAVVFKEVA